MFKWVHRTPRIKRDFVNSLYDSNPFLKLQWVVDGRDVRECRNALSFFFFLGIIILWTQLERSLWLIVANNSVGKDSLDHFTANLESIYHLTLRC